MPGSAEKDIELADNGPSPRQHNKANKLRGIGDTHHLEEVNVKWGQPFLMFAVDRPQLVTRAMLLVTIFLALLAILPSLWPATFSHLHPLKVDTDPENMLPADESVRVFHNAMKDEMTLYDMVIVGVVNETHPHGVFNVASLGKVHALTEFAKNLQWPDPERPGEKIGVVASEIVSPSTVDDISQAGLGTVRFDWLMRSPPTTEEGALAVRDRALRIPLMNGTLVAEDGKALAIYLPLTSKNLSFRVYDALRDKISELGGEEEFFITGLPVAEDAFGVEMFIQMGISAPLAMLVIFLLLLYFFRKLILITAPMVVAMVSVICTMALVVISGSTVHIMSSMIPIFIMPIAVLDSVHILSEYFDTYQRHGDRRQALLHVMDKLFVPMLFTSLTTSIAFASLALVPIPPLQVFGLFVAFGVALAWLLSVTFIPAFITCIPAHKLEGFGLTPGGDGQPADSFLARHLLRLGDMTVRQHRKILAGVLISAAIGVYGISCITINDNPVRWFDDDHPIRVADRVLNESFGGSYMAYLALEPDGRQEPTTRYANDLQRRLHIAAEAPGENHGLAPGVLRVLASEAGRLAPSLDTRRALLDKLDRYVGERLDQVVEDDAFYAWEQASLFIAAERQRGQVFKQPEVLDYLDKLQQHLLTTGIVGKSTSVTDYVKTVHRELMLGEDAAYRIPDSASGVAQTLMTYQNSHRPQDLWHFVTPDFRKASIWVQLKSGDNRDMSAVAAAVDRYLLLNPPPFNLRLNWFGLTHINLVWQEKMVSGMADALLGSFLIVLFLMTLLLRSAFWGLLAMVPLTATIGLIYGILGLIGKDYDMPVAVLSSLSLGMAIDFTIHFLVRARRVFRKTRTWAGSVHEVFGEPARAIVRNILVVSIGFLPLLAAPLVPYQTVGMLIATILLASGIGTLLILPALFKGLEFWVFEHQDRRRVATPGFVTYVFLGAVGVLGGTVALRRFLDISLTQIAWSTGALLMAAVIVYYAWFVQRDNAKASWGEANGKK